MRITPCESWPRRFARTSKDATQVASSRGAFEATKMSRVIRSSVSTSTVRMRVSSPPRGADRTPARLMDRMREGEAQNHVQETPMPAVDEPLLAGLTVLDFTRVLAGPYCTRLLCDLGARVIKVERPGEGDDTRRGHAQMEPGRSDQGTYFIRINAGKSSLALDLSHPKAREVVVDLARASDVVVENFLPGVVAKLGCDYAALSAVKPDLVYCSISGFGQSGLLRLQPAFHHIVNAMSGIMYLEQQTDPAPRPGYLQAADVLAGTHAFGAILAALWRRARTGRGAYLDVSMLECMVGAEDINYGGMLNAGAEYPGPRPGMIVHGIGGRHVAMQTVGAPQLWPRLVAMMDRPDLASDPRFATPAGRREHWAELSPIICTWLDRFATVEEAVKTLTA